MSARWRYQLSFGLIFAFTMTIISSGVTYFQHPAVSVFNSFFLLQLGLMLFGGVFIIGYLMWQFQKVRDDK